MTPATARRASALFLPIASIVVAAIVVPVMYGSSNVLTVLGHVNVGLIAGAFLIGGIIEVIRAGRTTLLLSQYRPIGFEETFGVQVVSHGFGHLIPFAPTTTALRCLLTHRVNGTPWQSSAGVFLGADMLDRAALLPLVLYPLASQVLPAWQRLLMSGLVVQSVALCLLLLAGGKITGFGLQMCRKIGTGKFVKRGMAMTDSVMTGMSMVSSCGTKKALSVASLTLLSTAVAMLQLKLLLMSVGLPASPAQLCLLLIFSSLVGCLPLPVPGAGTLATAKSLAGAGVLGSGIPGFTLVTSAVSTIETPLLAVCILMWWSLRCSPFSIGWREIREIREGLANAGPASLRVVDQPWPVGPDSIMEIDDGADQDGGQEHAA